MADLQNCVINTSARITDIMLKRTHGAKRSVIMQK